MRPWRPGPKSREAGAAGALLDVNGHLGTGRAAVAVADGVVETVRAFKVGLGRVEDRAGVIGILYGCAALLGRSAHRQK